MRIVHGTALESLPSPVLRARELWALTTGSAGGPRLLKGDLVEQAGGHAVDEAPYMVLVD